MNNILKFGLYHVESKPTSVSVCDVISVEIKTKDTKRISKRKYTFDELKDLDGRLVLITGNMADNRGLVDMFRDVRHCHYILFYN